MKTRNWLFLSSVLVGVSHLPPKQEPTETATEWDPYQVTLDALHHSDRLEAEAQFWRHVARCLGEPGSNAVAGINQAWADRSAAYVEADDRRSARAILGQHLGTTPYDPGLDPNQMASAITNPWFPFVPGRVLTYEKVTAAGLERIEVTMMPGSRLVDGLPCRTLYVEEIFNGEVKEITEDWFSQDAAGTVWYVGETSRQYEDGFLRSIEGSWLSGVDGARPGVMMPGTPVPQSVYRREFLPDDAEDVIRIVSLNETVTVATGTYTNCVKLEEWSPLERELEEKYFAPGVGLILEVNPATGERLELVDVQN